jgi:zinc finger HIT domain-containing protein 1
MAQKTFANYIADEEALAALEPQPAPQVKARPHRPVLTSDSRETSSSVVPQPRYPGVYSNTRSATESPSAAPKSGYPNNDAAEARLLQIAVPSAPSEALLDALVSAPPLPYNAIRAASSSSQRPQRNFCEFCGYWGLVKCLKCGARVCGLTCKKTHDDERCQKYFG